MPKIERPPYSVTRVITNAKSKYAKEQWQLLGRPKVFGRQIRQYRATKKAAEQLGEKYVAELEAHGQKATPLSDLKRADAVAAMLLLGDRADLVTAAKFYLSNGPRNDDITVEKALELFAATRGIPPEIFRRRKGMWRRNVQVRKGWSTKSEHSEPHRVTLANRLRRFESRFASELVRTLPADRIREYLEKSFDNTRTLENHRGTIHSFFEWAIQEGHCATNPAVIWTTHELNLEAYARGHVPDILKPEDFKRLMHAAQLHDPELIPYLAIGGYMAIRPEELEKLPWTQVHPSFVYVPAEISKTGDRAELKILPSLKRWLAVCRHRTGLVAPTDASRRRRALWRRAHGINPLTATRSEIEQCPEWPHDGLRHSFGTFRYKIVKDIGAVCAEMRHEDPLVFRKHYLQRGVTMQDAKAYFDVAPLSAKDL